MTEPAQMVSDEVPAEVPDTIPTSQVYLNPGPTINSTPSTVVTPIPTPSGVHSHNPLLSHIPSELWRYLLSNLEPPQMIIQVKGKIGPLEDDAYEEFSLSIDVSNEVDPQWSRILTTDGTSTIAWTLENYTSSSYSCREFRLKKVVVWDRERVIRLIKGVVKEATSGRFRGEAVKVKLRVSDYEVVAFPGSNWILRGAYNKFVRCLCCALCMCGVLCRKKQRLECEHRMAVSAEDLVSRNRGLISSGSSSYTPVPR